MNKAVGLIGLAKKAGRVVTGESGVKDAVRFNKACLVIIAGDASANTTKSITDSCKYYGVSYYIMATKDILGHAVGNSYNAAICITDVGFAKGIAKEINGGD